MSIKRLYLVDAAQYIGSKDKRTFLTFCEANRITIYTNIKRKYVLQLDLDLVLDKPLIQTLQESFPNDWVQLYKAYKANDILFLFNALHNQQSQDVDVLQKQIIQNENTPLLGSEGQSFLEFLNS